jgi:hypothetical protein
MSEIEFKPFSEWVDGWNNAVAGDGYEALSELSKMCIDAAINKYIEYRMEVAKKHFLKRINEY